MRKGNRIPHLLYSVARQALFLLPAEQSHQLSLELIGAAGRVGLAHLMPNTHCRPVGCMNMEFRNPVGLAAGLDKNATAVEGLMAMGFGFVEVGTVTPRPQEGNAKPRIFRLPKQQALINRMGFNNQGMLAMRTRLEKVRKRDNLAGGLIGVNIGKNKDTPNENAEDDYLACMDELYDLADYLTVNLSSPNTPGLRDLQSKARLQTLLSKLRERQLKLAQGTGCYRPLLLKVAPDLDAQEIQDVADAVHATEIDGVIATNTTLTRPIPECHHASESGGLSGKPLFELSLKCVGQMRLCLGDEIALIGVGGISDTSSALKMQDAGASMIQIYSAFIYQGPELVRRIASAW